MTAADKTKLDGLEPGVPVSHVRATKTSAMALSNVATTIDFDTVEYDTLSEYAGGVFTATVDGYYLVSSQFTAIGSVDDTKVIDVLVFVNGSQLLSLSVYGLVPVPVCQIATTVHLAIGDTVEIKTDTDHTYNLATNASANCLTIDRIR